MMPHMGLFEWGNYVEAAVWAAMAVFCAVRGARRMDGRLWALAVVLLLFGASDVIEVRTGAWYRPWWLLVWKGLCVVTILTLLAPYWRRKVVDE